MTEKACPSFVSQNILKITLFTMSPSGAELLFDQAQCLSHDPMNYGKKSNMLLIKEMEDYKSFWQTFTSKHSCFWTQNFTINHHQVSYILINGERSNPPAHFLD